MHSFPGLHMHVEKCEGGKDQRWGEPGTCIYYHVMVVDAERRVASTSARDNIK